MHAQMHDNKSLNEVLSEALKTREEKGLLRKLTANVGLTDFCSNDYLGFSHSFFSNNDIISSSDEHKCSGSTGSRLVSGNSCLAEETERNIAAFHNAESALLFSSGFMANIGLFSCIADKNTTYIYDEQVHASIKDGMRLSFAKRYKFNHNDINDLESKLKTAEGRKIVVVESLYSMDGDLGPLKEITSLCKLYNAQLIVDEAHSTGIYGKDGEGLVCEHNLEDEVWARVHTFGKAVGLHGAAVVGSLLLRNFLINHAHSFIYTTAMPPYAYEHLNHAYKMLPGADREGLFDLIHFFKKKSEDTKGIQFLTNPSPIQGILVGDNTKAASMADHLRKHGFFVKAILSPTVSPGTERIRICIHSYNTREEIDELFNAIKMFSE